MLLDARTVVSLLEAVMWIAVAVGFLALAWALVKLDRRLRTIERELGLVSKMQRSQTPEPQQVVAERPDSN